MNNRIMSAVFAALLSWLVAAPSHAQVVLDQDAFVAPSPTGLRELTQIGSFTVPSGLQINNLMWGQSVTAGQTGLLSMIQVQGPFQSFSNSVPITFSLYSGVAGQAGSTLLGAYNRLAIDLPLFSNSNDNVLGVASFGVSDFGYVVHPGDVFSFTIGMANPVPQGFSDFIVVGNVTGFSSPGVPILAPNAYAGGTELASASGSAFGIAAALPDLGFRTFVDTTPAAVPEPASWALMLLGFGLFGFVMRWRSTVRTTVRYT